MKNYLFAPFKDDEDKIEEFNSVIRGLNYEVSDVTPSLTDAEVNHYHESALHGLRIFIGRLESYYDVIISKLKAEIKDVHDEIRADNIDLVKENEELKKGLFTDDVDELKADIQKLKAENGNLMDDLEEEQANVKRHEKQYHMLASSRANSNDSSQYKKEAEEYFHHNPKADKLFFFMVGSSDIDEDGDVISTLNVGADTIAECDNYKGVISVETYD